MAGRVSSRPATSSRSPGSGGCRPRSPISFRRRSTREPAYRDQPEHRDLLFRSPLAFVDTASLPPGERHETSGRGRERWDQPGYTNPAEAELLTELAGHYHRQGREWAVIVPYKAQATLITNAVTAVDRRREAGPAERGDRRLLPGWRARRHPLRVHPQQPRRKSGIPGRAAPGQRRLLPRPVSARHGGGPGHADERPGTSGSAIWPGRCTALWPGAATCARTRMSAISWPASPARQVTHDDRGAADP